MRYCFWAGLPTRPPDANDRKSRSTAPSAPNSVLNASFERRRVRLRAGINQSSSESASRNRETVIESAQTCTMIFGRRHEKRRSRTKSVEGRKRTRRRGSSRIEGPRPPLDAKLGIAAQKLQAATTGRASAPSAAAGRTGRRRTRRPLRRRGGAAGRAESPRARSRTGR